MKKVTQRRQHAQSKSTVSELSMVSYLSRLECVRAFQLILGVPVLQMIARGCSEIAVLGFKS